MDNEEIKDFVEEGLDTTQKETVESTGEELIDTTRSAEKEDVVDNTKEADTEVKEVKTDEKSFLLDQQEGTTSALQINGLLNEIKKLRAEKRALKLEVEAALKNLRPDGVDVSDDNANLQFDTEELLPNMPDDEFVDQKTLKETIKRVADVVSNKTLSAIKAEQVKTEQQEFVRLCQQSEAMARKEIADYAEILGMAKELNLLTNEDRASAMRSPHPAKALYEAAQTKIKKMRDLLNPQTSETKINKKVNNDGQKTIQDEILETPEEVFDKMFSA